MIYWIIAVWTIVGLYSFCLMAISIASMLKLSRLQERLAELRVELWHLPEDLGEASRELDRIDAEGEGIKREVEGITIRRSLTLGLLK